MKIKFLDRETRKDAVLGDEATEFFVNSEGKVVEFVEQEYANFYAHFEREDVVFETLDSDS